MPHVETRRIHNRAGIKMCHTDSIVGHQRHSGRIVMTIEQFMNPHTTRRDFLGSAVVLGGWLAAHGTNYSAPAQAEESGSRDSGAAIKAVATESGRNAAIAVITQSVARDVQPAVPGPTSPKCSTGLGCSTHNCRRKR